MALKPGVANLSVRLLERRTRRVIAEEGGADLMHSMCPKALKST